MAMIRLEGLNDLLEVKVLRERLGNGITASSTLKDGRPGFELVLRPAKGDNKKIYEGRLKYPLFLDDNRLVYPVVNVYGCLCEFPDGVQAISLKKARGSFVDREVYKKIDQILMAVLRRHLLAKLLDVELECKEIEQKEGTLTATYVVKHPGLWGPQRCADFEWRDEAIAAHMELEESPVDGKRGPYRVCKNCVHRDNCALYLQIKANRKREEVPVEVVI